MRVSAHEKDSERVISALVSEFEDFQVDNTSINRSVLDVSERSRKSIFRWSGQFPPELVRALLDRYAAPESVILDPFAGSGTVLFESAAKHLSCFGADINPAAVELSKTVLFCNVKVKDRVVCLNNARELLQAFSEKINNGHGTDMKLCDNDYIVFRQIVGSAEEPLVKSILLNVLMRFSSLREKDRLKGLWNAFEVHKKIIEELPYSTKRYDVFNADARKLPIKSKSVDLVITSPPYINVFDYYKNYKKAAYVANWSTSETAKMEIGHYRKTGNRFLDIVHYAIDIYEVFRDIRRVMKDEGRLILIIEDESEIMGVRFRNSELLYALAVGQSWFRMVTKQEREFVGRSGKIVREHLLHFVPEKESINADQNFPTGVAFCFLKGSLQKAKGTARVVLSDAIMKANSISH